MSKKFSKSERNILYLFKKGVNFTHENNRYEVLFAGKPTCHKGEPKTDIYVCAKSQIGIKEFKISFKQKNADFLENKTTKKRAEALLGDNWSEIIVNATKKLSDNFNARPLIYKKSHGRTEAGSFTLGWRFELLRVKNGKLSEPLNLNKQQIMDVYAGTSLPEDKRNALVNDHVIKNSGIANYILFGDEEITDAQTAIDKLIPIDAYIEKYPQIFFACKASNYRTKAGKCEGNRSLAVYVDWEVIDNKLSPKLIFDYPLIAQGKTVACKLLESLKKLGITSMDDLNMENVLGKNIFYE